MSKPVAEWLHDLGLGEYAASFAAHDIDWELLAELDQQTLKDIGVESAGHRLRLLKAARSLGPGEPASENTAATEPTAEHGDELAGWSRTPGERKPVTMLFADIVGSTSLTEKLDAEEAHDLLYQAARRMCGAVEANGGTVCRFMGDGIMAMFGAPVASERHALEACRAALAMQREIQGYAGELQARHGAGVQARVGLHSGEVVVLEVGDDPDRPEYDASGPTVPLAARMEQSADAGGILITEATRALAGEYVEAEPRDAIEAKGVSGPVAVYRLIDVVSATAGLHRTSRQAFVGRRLELAQFDGLLDVCIESGYGKTVYIRGEAGIGKTRLVEEITHAAERRGLAQHKALVLDFGAGKGQEAIPALLRSLLGIPSGAGRKQRRNKLLAAENDGLAHTEDRVFLNDLLDLPQPLELRTMYDAMKSESRASGKREAMVQVVRNLARRKPLLIVIEDLHWADNVTLDYLASLAAAVAECPAFLIMTSRFEGDPLDSSWRAQTGESRITTWDLGPLRRDESISLVSSFIDSSDKLAQQCIERAAGNPLFLEQLLLSLQKGLPDSLPDSIRSLILTRIDHVLGADKRALQAAAVLGQRFELDALRHLLDSPEYDCRNLIEHRLVRPEGSQFLFAHALIQEAAYGSLLKRQRGELHQRAAEWYRDRDSILYAEHLDQAEDSAAPRAYLEAARQQSEQYRVVRALQLVARGLEIAPAADAYDLLVLQASLLHASGQLAESIEAYTKARDAAGNDRDLCHALVGMAQGKQDIDAPEEIFALLDQAEAIARAHSLDYELARIYIIRGGQFFFNCDIEACLESSREALAFARNAGSPEIYARALSGLGDAEYCRGHVVSALGYFDECIALAREHGIGRIIAANLVMKSLIDCWMGDIAQARNALEEGRELAIKTHDLRAEMLAEVGGSYLFTSTGNLDEGEACIERALDLSHRLGSSLFEGDNLCYLARLRYFQGRRADSCRIAMQSVEMLRQTDSGLRFAGPAPLAVFALATDDDSARREAWREGEAILGSGSLCHSHYNFYEDAIEACVLIEDWDELERFAASLDDYNSAEPVARCDFVIARGRALAAFGRGRRDEELIGEMRQLCRQGVEIGLAPKVSALEAALAQA